MLSMEFVNKFFKALFAVLRSAHFFDINDNTINFRCLSQMNEIVAQRLARRIATIEQVIADRPEQRRQEQAAFQLGQDDLGATLARIEAMLLTTDIEAWKLETVSAHAWANPAFI
mgnify:CR=1 FL=1